MNFLVNSESGFMLYGKFSSFICAKSKNTVKTLLVDFDVVPLFSTFLTKNVPEKCIEKR